MDELPRLPKWFRQVCEVLLGFALACSFLMLYAGLCMVIAQTTDWAAFSTTWKVLIVLIGWSVIMGVTALLWKPRRLLSVGLAVCVFFDIFYYLYYFVLGHA